MAQPIPKLRFVDLVPPGGWFHVARTTFRAPEPLGLHTHDFAEVFWVESGRVSHSFGGRRGVMTAGQMCFVRASDRHAVSATAAGPGTIVNVAFPTRCLDELRPRYYPGAPWPWTDADRPKVVVWDRPGLDRMARRAALLDDQFAKPHRRVAIDLFLLNTIDDLMRGQDPASEHHLPGWLGDALEVMRREPDRLAQGRDALARLASKTPDHINRELRRHTGRTTTDWVNGLRLEHAAHRLRSSDDAIVDIAIDVGLDNLSYFYRLFKDRFGLTPRRYRRRHTLPVRGTD